MGLAQRIQEAWNKQSQWLVLLRPLSCLYSCGFQLNKQLYLSGLKKVYQAPVPVMVIGNITVGGSGKTPLLIQLVKYLQQHQVRVGVISRGYGGTGPFPALVLPDSPANVVGDEPCLIVQNTHVPMAVGSNRQQAIELLLKHHQLDLIISDDGLQHWALARQIEWIVLDQNRGLGNQKLLPEGYLREPPSSLTTATVIEHASQPNSELNMHLEVAAPYLLNDAEDERSFNPADNFYAVVGIGFPQRFYSTLDSMGIHQFQCHEFPDHYDYEITDLQFEDNNPIITTEKDAVKLSDRHGENVWVLPVCAIIEPDLAEFVAQRLNLTDACLKSS